MSPNIVISLSNGDLLTFSISNVDVSVVNALRRTILTDIPTPVFKEEDMIFHKNTSRLNNEIIKQRLGCIPIFINDLNIPLDDYVVEIRKKNESNSVEFITTEEFQIKNLKSDKYLKRDQVKKIFPPNKITKDYILLTRLKPRITKNLTGEELSLSAKMSIGVAKENGMYNVVSTVSFVNKIDPIKQQQEWSKYEKQMQKLEMPDDERELEKLNWYNHQGKRYFTLNSFEFILETLGNFTNEEIIKKACQIIISKLELIEINKDSYDYEESKNTLPNSYDIILKNEDYTIGKLLESILHNSFYLKKRILNYVGIIKEPTHNSSSIIRIAFSQKKEPGYVLNIINEACLIGKDIFTQISQNF